MTTPWVFVRHGESTANAGGWLAGHRDAPLTARGRRQAADLASRLDCGRFTRVFSSDASRAIDTATILLQGRRSPEPHAALRERYLGDWEGADRASLGADGRLDTLLDWGGRPPGGESLADCAERMLRWLIAHESDEATLVVAHGALLRATVGILDGRPLDTIGRWHLGNAIALERRYPAGAFLRVLSTLPR